MNIFKRSKQKKINSLYKLLEGYNREITIINEKLSKGPNTDEYFALKFKKEDTLKKIDETCLEIHKLQK